ncbi:MAG: dihydrolipoamide acetyltransferase family protein [Eubacteriales bacterium]|mgnify:FL=1|nr:2-oxo acid dehydrogenase subunit E2 [Candidatus Colimorpha enterica]MDY2906867.1 dihydrolipoamide acetyltransferase family protein [Eubacteriales bacterium]
MAHVVIMPRQGQSVESCIITEWKKKVGDKVAVKDVLFSYETDKSSFDELSEVEGTLLAVFAAEGDDVECLRPVCVIGNEGEDISALIPKDGSAPAEEAKPEEKKEEAAKPEAPKAEAVSTAADNGDGRMKISPRARHLAERTDADLSRAVPTGPNGRIIERDVNALLDKGFTNADKAEVKAEAAPAAKAEAPAAKPENTAEYTDVRLPNIRKVIARSMHASLSNMAQLTLNSSFDATQIMAYRKMLKANAEALGMNNITLNDIVLYAVAKTIPAFRDLNAHYLDDKEIIRYFNTVNLGIAVDTERGLLVPTVFGAEKLSLNDLAGEAKSVITAAQKGQISPDKLKGASFTVTNLGAMGIESFTPVINPPQTGILGVGAVTYRVKADGSTYPAMGLSLTFDHRALDGAPAAKFLKALCDNLANFNLLLAK